MNSLDVYATRVRKEHEVIVRTRSKEMLDEIIRLTLSPTLTCGHANHAFTTATLRSIGTDIRALDQTVVRDRDNDPLVGDKVFNGNFSLIGNNIGEARSGIFSLNLVELGLDDAHHAGFPGENIDEILYLPQKLRVFAFDFVAFQSRQLIQTQIENRICLRFTECVATIRQPRGITNQDCKLFHGIAREVECHPI